MRQFPLLPRLKGTVCSWHSHASILKYHDVLLEPYATPLAIVRIGGRVGVDLRRENFDVRLADKVREIVDRRL